LKVAAFLTFALSDQESTLGLAAVLTPDNEGLPSGLRVSMARKAERIRIDVESGSPSTAVSTVLAVLRDVALFQEVWLLSRGKPAQVQRA